MNPAIAFRYEWLHLAFVGRRPIQRRHRHIVQPQIHRELSAVMNDVIHDPCCERQRCAARVKIAFPPASSDHCCMNCSSVAPATRLAHSSNIFVEFVEQLLARLGRLFRLHRFAFRSDVERIPT